MASSNIARYKNLGSYIQNIENRLAQAERNRSKLGAIASGAIGSTHLSGQVILDGNSIQSANYAQGAAGWNIDGSGNAEFSNVFVRGNINADSGTIGVWNLSSEQTTRTFDRNTVLIYAVTGTDGIVSYSYYIPNFAGTNYFYTGEYVNISGITTDVNSPVDGLGFNIQSAEIIDSGIYANGDTTNNPDGYGYAGYFKIANSTSETYVSGGTASKVYVGTYIENVDLGFDDSVGATGTYVGLYTSQNLSTSGIYLRDYDKVTLDYGYFSTEGVSYNSTNSVNLIWNPSFEFYNDATYAPVSSLDGITSTDSGAFSSYTFINSGIMDYSTYTSVLDPLYENSSFYGILIPFSDTPRSDYITLEVDYRTGINRKIFGSSTRPLYFNFDLFFNYINAKYMTTTWSISNVEVSVGSVPITTVTTLGNHDLVVGDLVAFDASWLGTSSGFDYLNTSSSVYNSYTDILGAEKNTYIVRDVPTSNTFVIDNSINNSAYDNEIVNQVAYDGSPYRNLVGKFINATYDLSEIKIQFGDDTSTSLVDIITDYNKYDSSKSWDYHHLLHNDTGEYVKSKLTHPVGGNPGSAVGGVTWAELTHPVFAIKPMHFNNKRNFYVEIDPLKIVNIWSQLTDAQAVNDYVAQNNFKILLPTWAYSSGMDGTILLDGSSNPIKITTTSTDETIGLIFDNFYLSQENKFFFGDTTKEHPTTFSDKNGTSWIDSTTSGSAVPLQSSASYIKNWIDIDIRNQTASLNYFDYIGFSNQSNHYTSSGSYISSFITDISSENISGGLAPVSYTIDPLSGASNIKYLPLSGGDWRLGGVGNIIKPLGTLSGVRINSGETLTPQTPNNIMSSSGYFLNGSELTIAQISTSYFNIPTVLQPDVVGSIISVSTHLNPEIYPNPSFGYDYPTEYKKPWDFALIDTGRVDINADSVYIAGNKIYDVATGGLSIGATPGTTDPTKTASSVGYLGMPEVLVTSGGRTLDVSDAGKLIYVITTSGQTITIPDNATIPFEIGTSMAIVNRTGGTITVHLNSPTTDHFYLAGTGTTGDKTLSNFGMATIVKVNQNAWMISGTGVS